MGKPASGVRKPTAKRTEVVEALFAHVAAKSMLFKIGSRGLWCPLPVLSGVPLPSAGRILAVHMSITAAANIVLIECAWC